MNILSTQEELTINAEKKKRTGKYRWYREDRKFIMKIVKEGYSDNTEGTYYQNWTNTLATHGVGSGKVVDGSVCIEGTY